MRLDARRVGSGTVGSPARVVNTGLRSHRIGRQRLVKNDVAAQARQREVGELAARAAQGRWVVDLVRVRQLRARARSCSANPDMVHQADMQIAHPWAMYRPRQVQKPAFKQRLMTQSQHACMP